MKSLSNKKRLFKQKRLRYLLVVLMVISLLLGIVIVPFEFRQGTIKTPFDGIWWAVTTITTVGYGDFVPVTDIGKMIGIVLQIVGAMMFGMLIAIISNHISRTQDEFYWNRLFERMDRLESQVEELRKRTGYMLLSDHEKEKQKEQTKKNTDN